MRGAIAELDGAGLRPDAARALALLAMMSGDAAARAEARARLAALGDRLFLARLDETA